MWDAVARRSAECFVQVVNLLNFDYEAGAGEDLCEGVLSTLTALLAGNEASRRRLVADVGYDQILTALDRQVGLAFHFSFHPSRVLYSSAWPWPGFLAVRAMARAWPCELAGG